jgi:hypothetical protein
MTGGDPKRSDLIINDAGEAIFKIVAVGYAGAVDWVIGFHDRTDVPSRGLLHPVTENEGWRLVAYDLSFEGMRVRDHAVRLYLFGHEGIGFIGQPGAAKDVVYKNAHAVVGLANAGDVKDLVSVLTADLERGRSQGQHPAFVLATGPSVSPSLPDSLPKTHVVSVDWRSEPMEPLNVAATAILDAFR